LIGDVMVTFIYLIRISGEWRGVKDFHDIRMWLTKYFLI
jgi:hypothetical protein